MDFNKQIKNIEKDLTEYYDLSFKSESEEIENNKLVKNKIKHLIEKCNSNEFVLMALTLLVNNTGCVQDEKIANSIVDELHKNNYLNEEQLAFFYAEIGTNRWR